MRRDVLSIIQKQRAISKGRYCLTVNEVLLIFDKNKHLEGNEALLETLIDGFNLGFELGQRAYQNKIKKKK